MGLVSNKESVYHSVNPEIVVFTLIRITISLQYVLTCMFVCDLARARVLHAFRFGLIW